MVRPVAELSLLDPGQGGIRLGRDLCRLRPEISNDRCPLHRRRIDRIRRLRRLRRLSGQDLTMIVGLIYAAAALGVAVYMVAALLRPDKF
jgi:hypothetical protein